MRKLKIVIVAVLLSSLFVMVSYAGQWKADEKGYWWQEDDGSYPVNTWRWIDGDGDGISECYYFDGNGYMLSDTITQDGNQVNENGAWVTDGGIVQTMNAMEIAEQKVLAYYNELYPTSDGTYVIFESETIIKDDYYVFMVRWQISEEEQKRRMREEIPATTNLLCGVVYFNIETEEMRIEE
ncbi:hypothetical protein [Brotaphodocola sp.]|uniref:hypothetical protein n=1 Tax=Brotaphodocola sp. TaxID=3073577 RepID=UPI003D7C3DFA